MIVTLDQRAYDTDADTAAAVRAVRVPVDADPGWRPLTFSEARRRFPNATFTPVDVERTPNETVEAVGARSDLDVLDDLLGSVVFDRVVAPVDDDEPED